MSTTLEKDMTEYVDENRSEWFDKFIEENKMLKMTELEELFRCKRGAIENWVEQGRFPQPIYFGRNKLWRKEDIDKVLPKGIK